MATDTAGLVFNFPDPYPERAEFDSASIKTVPVTPIPAALRLFGSGLPVLICVTKKKSVLNK